MERIMNIYKKLVIAIVFISGMFMTSCTDFLTIIPPSKVVHEDFWHTEAEVNGMMATAYLTLCNSSCISNAIMWGETRAETVDYPLGANNNSIIHLTEGLLYDDNAYASWAEYYKAINYCNLVMEYGPTVMDHDPSFTEGEMQVIKGQMLALRAYAHFVLLRAFCNIPMATQVVINDAEMPDYPQVHPMKALQMMYDDLEQASTMVLLSGVKSAENLGYITTNAVHALMADINMWQAAFAEYYLSENNLGVEEAKEAKEYIIAGAPDIYYDMAIEHCQYILDAMDKIHEENYVSKLEKPTEFNLLANRGSYEQQQWGYSTVYEDIFGTGQNSSESIFEFQIDDKNYAEGNNGISAVFGAGGNNGGRFVVQKNFLETKFENDDLRKYAFTTLAAPGDGTVAPEEDDEGLKETFVAKYTAKNTVNTKGAERTYRSSDDYNAHWIMYRKTEIMLTLAEALLSRSAAKSNPDDVEKAFKLAAAINTRWKMIINENGDRQNVKQLSDYTEVKKCLEFVRDERARELCFEGRRWYDIVRMALQGQDVAFSYEKKRHGVDNDEMKRRYVHISAYFMPIAKDEIRFNHLLKQNKSCKSTDDDSSITQK